LRLKLAGHAATDTDAAAHQRAAREIAAAAVTVLRGACTGPQVTGPVRVTASNGRDTQAAWLRDALAKGAAVTVAMDTPYLLRYADSKVRIATYSSTKVAMEALADVLAGKAAPA